jgi:tetratricopeptide (TPR) repeat protein
MTEIDPKYAKVYYLLARILKKQGKLEEEAIQNYKKAIEINPNFPDKYNLSSLL